MIAQIVAGTPIWVPVVFIVLLAYGLLQSRTRALNAVKVLMLPIIMIVLSIAGVFSSFGPQPEALVAWVIGFALAVAANRVIKAPAGVIYERSTRLFHVPGSYTPLALMMAIFFAKYVNGAMTAMQPATQATPAFAAILSFVFGLLSGTFFARFLHLWAAKNRPHPSLPETPNGLEPIR